MHTPILECDQCNHTCKDAHHFVASELNAALQRTEAFFSGQLLDVDRYAAESIRYGVCVGRGEAPDTYNALHQARSRLAHTNDSFLEDALVYFQKMMEQLDHWLPRVRWQESAPLSDEELARYAQATGTDLETAEGCLLEMEPALQRRVLRAAACQQGLLNDPIEDEPGMREVLAKASEEGEMRLLALGRGRDKGYCRELWRAMKDILSERFGVSWYSPAEMNPNALFD